MKVTRKTEDITLDVINLVLGGVLFLSPWIFGFASEHPASYNAWIAGILIAGLAVAALYAFELWEEGVQLVVGLWSAVSPWVLGFAANPRAMWPHVGVGLIVAIIAVIELWRQHDRPQTAS